MRRRAHPRRGVPSVGPIQRTVRSGDSSVPADIAGRDQRAGADDDVSRTVTSHLEPSTPTSSDEIPLGGRPAGRGTGRSPSAADCGAFKSPLAHTVSPCWSTSERRIIVLPEGKEVRGTTSREPCGIASKWITGGPVSAGIERTSTRVVVGPSVAVVTGVAVFFGRRAASRASTSRFS